MVELTWDGKYDADGQRVAPLRVALPFQTVETVNESAQQRQLMLDLFSAGRDLEWRNRLIWGDRKYVLPSLLPEFAGKVGLIYIDPPFATGTDFSFKAEVGEEEFVKEASVIEQKAYRDTWGRGLDSYMEWFYETSVLLYELLSEDGSIYVHCDWHVGHYIKIILDELFGRDNFRNQIIWHYPGREMHIGNKYNAKHDIICFYAKSEATKINMANIAVPYDLQARVKTLRRKVHKDPDGREWVWETRGQASGQEPYKRYLDDIVSQGKALNDVWSDIQFLRGNHPERVDYATQKPEALLERIIRASSNEGDLVLDCFCGSGTTAAVAEKLNRRWIACDLGRFAVHTTRKRLLGIEGVRPFVVQNLGKYERQVWQQAEFGEQAEATIHAYRRFILDLYHAEPIEGYIWLHGKKAGRMVHVGTVDSPIALGDIKQIAIEFRRAIGTGKNAPLVAGVDVLGWDFALDMNETAKQIAQEVGLDVRFVRIPREVLEKKAVEQGDIRFFELAALSVDTQVKGREVTITLTDFMVPPDDVPQEVINAVTHWSEWIDYWAVDFNYCDDAFHNEWQSYRTRQDRKLQLGVRNKYDQPGTYTVLVKVIDILGNDTTKAIEVEMH